LLIDSKAPHYPHILFDLIWLKLFVSLLVADFIKFPLMAKDFVFVAFAKKISNLLTSRIIALRHQLAQALPSLLIFHLFLLYVAIDLINFLIKRRLIKLEKDREKRERWRKTSFYHLIGCSSAS
jgi:hypothetical protein